MRKILAKTDDIEISITEGYQLYIKPEPGVTFELYGIEQFNLYITTVSRCIKNAKGMVCINVVDSSDTSISLYDLQFSCAHLQEQASKVDKDVYQDDLTFADEVNARFTQQVLNIFDCTKGLKISKRQGYSVTSNLEGYAKEINKLYNQVTENQTKLDTSDWTEFVPQFTSFGTPIKCECGAEHVGSPRHSAWCAKYTKET